MCFDQLVDQFIDWLQQHGQGVHHHYFPRYAAAAYDNAFNGTFS